jgi:phage FluMu gp28-like protein
LRAKARFRVLACGRRWGKTDAAAADLAARIVTTRSSRQLAIAPTAAQAKIVFERVVWMLTVAGISFLPQLSPFPAIRILEGKGKHAAALHILDARSGHEERFLRGLGADHILIDEAAFVPNTLIADTAMPMLATTGGRMTLISTPFGRNHFYRYFLKGQIGESDFWSHTGPSDENPAVDPNYLSLQREIMTESSFATEYLAEFRDSNATVFGYEFIQNALSAPVIVKGPIMVGADWARHKDFTAVVAMRGTRMGAEVIACDAWTNATWRHSVSKVLEFTRAHGATQLVCDATGVGDFANEELRKMAQGCKVGDFTFTRHRKHAIINDLAWMLEHGRMRLPADPDLIKELEAFEMQPTDTVPKYGASFGHDDRVCALALACHGLLYPGAAQIIGRERK